MTRKFHFAGFATIAAILSVIFASTAFSGANAESGIENETTEISRPAPSANIAETVPAFTSEPVIQTIPAEQIAAEKTSQTDEADAVPTQNSSQNANSLSELVSQTSIDAQLSREMECLAGTVYFEARGEPLQGQLAVAQVVINRSQSDVFPSSYCGVVHQPSQFSFVKGGRMPSIARNSSAWKQAKAIARIAHEGQWKSEVRDALYFHAKYVNPSWSRRKTRRASISTHVFYR